MVVVDASVAVDIFLNRLGTPLHARLYRRCEELHAPHLLDLEVTQTIGRLVRARLVSAEHGWMILESLLLEFPVERHPHSYLIPRIWELRDRMSAYDASYLALADTLGCPLLTRDKAFTTFGGHRAKVEVF